MRVKQGLAVVLILLAQFSFAQKEFIKEADKLFDAGAYSEAAPMYLSLLQQSYDYDQNLKLAYCYLNLNMVSDAEHWYGVLADQHTAEPDILFTYAQLLKANGKYKTAKEWFLEYAKYNEDGYYLAGTCDFAAVLIQQPQHWTVDTISINTKGSDMAPAFYRSGILFASTGEVSGDKKQQINKSAGLPFYDIYYAPKGSDGNFRSSTMLETINTNLHEAAAVYDERTNQLVFTRNNFYKGRQNTAKDGSVKLELFVSQFIDGEFKKEKPFVLGSKEYSVGQPCISPDGTIMIFTSDMPGGFGGSDIYFSQRIADAWTAPVNLGPVINTKGNEMFPFISAEGDLYFASNWHPGLGGYDIFISSRNEGNWTKPLNPGSPVNSSRDDFGFIIKNGLGYLSSNRPGGKGSDDIYACTRLQEVQSLLIRNSKLQNVIGAKVTIYAGDHISGTGYTDVNGVLPIELSTDEAYAVTIEKDGYLETNMMQLEQYRSNNGILPVHLQELYEVNEVPDLMQEEIIKETTADEMELLESNETEVSADTLFVPDEISREADTEISEEANVIPEPETYNSNNTSMADAAVNAESVGAAEVLAVTAPVLLATTPDAIAQELPENNTLVAESAESVSETPATDVVTYEVQLGVFRNPDFTKTESFKIFGEIQSVKKDDGTFRLYVNNIKTRDDAETVRSQAIAKGFNGAFIITYKNGVRTN